MARITQILAQSQIRASRHGDRVFYSLDLHALLPKGRKPHLCTTMVCPGAVQIRPLYGYATGVNISPPTWRALVAVLPVVSDRHFPVEITPHIVAAARDHESGLADAAEQTLERNACPGYTPVTDPVAFNPAA